MPLLTGETLLGSSPATSNIDGGGAWIAVSLTRIGVAVVSIIVTWVAVSARGIAVVSVIVAWIAVSARGVAVVSVIVAWITVSGRGVAVVSAIVVFALLLFRYCS